MERKTGIDGLRGIAALSVLLFHLWLYARAAPPAVAVNGPWDWVWSNLRWGLILFFVLSGYLLYWAWIRAAAHGKRPDTWRYARSRVARVLPAYYLALVGSVLLLWEAGSVPGVRLPSAESLPLFLVFAQNFSGGSLLTLDPPMWTLAVEVSFYVALPVIGLAAFHLGSNRRIWLPIGLLAFGLAWGWGVSATGGPLTMTKVLPAMLPFFATGMLAATLAGGHQVGKGVARLLGLMAAAGLAIEVSAGLLFPTWLNGALHDIPIATSCAALVVLATSDRCPKVLRWKPLVSLGVVSYGLYLWHVPVLWWLRSRGLLPLDPILALPVVLIPSLGLATTSWLVVERPAIAWAKRRSGRDLKPTARFRNLGPAVQTESR